MHANRHLACIAAATVGGAAIGSLILGLCLGLVSLLNTESSYFGPGLKIGGGVFFGVIAFFFSLIPVAVVTAILGPVLLLLSRRNGQVRAGLYFGWVTGVVTLPWIVFGGGYGIVGSAAMLLTYGYPAAAIYLFVWRTPRRVPEAACEKAAQVSVARVTYS